MKINCNQIIYIKLGEGGDWEKECLMEQPSIRIGFIGVDERDCLNGDWEKVRNYFITKENKIQAAASDHVRELKIFYESSENDIWITFADNKMWWCFPGDKFSVKEDNSKVRSLKKVWSDEDINGKKLTLGDLGGKLTKTQGYRKTICHIEEKEYTLRKINGLDSKEVTEAKEAKQNLMQKIEKLIQSLSWKDFELLTDLIFRQAGWQRLSEIGKTAKWFDLELLHPVTGERCLVQIKSKSNNQEIKKHVEKFQLITGYDKFFFVVHSETDRIEIMEFPNVQLINSKKLSELVINAGLMDWIFLRN